MRLMPITVKPDFDHVQTRDSLQYLYYEDC